MWSIQEGLLQQYRSMAVSLMGLISAGLLVTISHISGNWLNYESIMLKPPTDWLKQLSDLTILAMLAALLILGFSASSSFIKVTRKRGEFVTFYQNLLLAEDSSQLEKICVGNNIPYPVDPIILLRRFSNPQMESFAFERKIAAADFNSFCHRVNEIGGRNEDPLVRHNAARSFLSKILFRVFNVFFGLCSTYGMFVVAHLLS